MIHTKNNAYALVTHANAMYPSQLMFESTEFAQSQGSAFLDLLLVSTLHLVHTMFFKPTNHCICIPVSSHTPTWYKSHYMKGKDVRYLPLNNQCVRYELCPKRLKIPLKFWYPVPLQCEHKARYVEYWNQQREAMHVLCMPYHSALQIQ